MNRSSLLFFFFFSSIMSFAAPEFYVSPVGRDRNSGTKQAPFRTLERARDALRKADCSRGATVYLRGGIYERKASFELTREDSGSAAAAIVWRSFPGEKARILGGKTLDRKLATLVADPAILNRVVSRGARASLRQIDLKAVGITDFGEMRVRGFRRPYIPAPLEVFIGDTALRLARWPNDRAVRIGKVYDVGSMAEKRGGTFEFTEDRLPLWKEAIDIWLSGYWGYGFADDTLKVKSIDWETKCITLAQPHRYGLKNDRPFHTYYALNLLEEIDRPGEYYIDRERGVLYFLPPENDNGGSISVSLLEEPMVVLENASHIHFRDLTFEVGRGIGIYIEGGEKNRIAACTIRNFGIVGVCLGKGIAPDTEYRHNFTGTPISRAIGSWHEHIYENPVFDREAGTDHLISGCDIYNIGAGGVHLGGGDRAKLIPARNTVRNCHIHHVNRLDFTYKAGINIDGCGNRIINCNIHDCAASAIYLHGNNHLIEYNEISFACLVADDMGALYLGRDPAEFGNIIRYNFWHHIGIGPRSHGTNVIYFDDGACGSQTYGNVFYKGGNGRTFLIGGGSNNPVTDNILIESPVAFHIDNRLQNWAKSSLKRPGGIFESRLSLVNYDKPPYTEQYPELATYWENNPEIPRNNPVRNNVVVSARKVLQGKADWGPVENNLVIDHDPGFRDWGRLDFRLNPDSEIFAALPDFKVPPFERMGLIVDEDRPTLPKPPAIPFPAPDIIPANGALIQGEGEVVLASHLRNGDIRYTLDGSEPTMESLLYTSPFSVAEKATVKARAVDPQTGELGDVSSQTFHLIVPGNPRKATVDGWFRSGEMQENGGVVVNPQGSMGNCEDGDFVAFGPFVFTTKDKITEMEAIVGIDPKYAGQKTHICLDSKDGPTIGTFVWESTGSFHTYKPQKTKLVPFSGTHRIVLVMEGGSGICNIERFRFLPPQEK